MTIIGITGGSGGGKTSALRALRSLGALVIDCDGLYHELLEVNIEMIGEIAARFEGVVKDGKVDRKALGVIVFNDAGALTELNGITHKYVSVEVERRLKEWEARGGTLAAVDAIALIESGLSGKCDIVVGVTAPVENRIKRIMERDGLSEEYARMRIGAQKPDSFFYDHCDYVLVSDCETVELFEEKCVDFFKRILEEK
ncbi:MAG: dephospho-CoA kinase [Clostridiales bacterium]|jgi:dephospho-CoA kinase|nr:dephospho-CoA kinase [Clostridiales bacterium]